MRTVSLSVFRVSYCVSVLLIVTNVARSQQSLSEGQCFLPNGKVGNCIAIEECTNVFNYIKVAPKPLPPSIVLILQKLTCGYDKNMPLVCCKDSNYQNPTEATNTVSTQPLDFPNRQSYTDPADVSNHTNLRLLPTNICGPINAEKLSGGNSTDLFEFPWMVLLQYETRTGLDFLCGGSLISSRYILTAAHCVTQLASQTRLVSVRLGEYDINTDIDCQTIDSEKLCADPVQDIPVEEIIAHPNYNRPRFANDVAIVRLSRPANMVSDSVRPICLPIVRDVQIKLPPRVTISGWGTTEDQRPSSQLLKAFLPIVKNDDCQEFFKRSIALSSSQMCAGGETGVDSCKGDSGGPLFFPSYSKMVQFGIISAGLESCQSTNNYPGIYTRVSHYLKWILDGMRV